MCVYVCVCVCVCVCVYVCVGDMQGKCKKNEGMHRDAAGQCLKSLYRNGFHISYKVFLFAQLIVPLILLYFSQKLISSTLINNCIYNICVHLTASYYMTLYLNVSQ